MVVVNRSEIVDEVLQISGLSGKWAIVPTRDEAMSTFDGAIAATNEAERAGGAGTLLTAISGGVALLALLLLADGVLAGAAATRLGTAIVYGAGALAAVAAVVVGVIAVGRSYGTVKLVAVSVTTLAAVVALAGLILLLGRSAGPAAPRPPAAPAPGAEKPRAARVQPEQADRLLR